jgi:hypothetical protein
MRHKRRQQKRSICNPREEEPTQQHLQLVAKARVRHIRQAGHGAVVVVRSGETHEFGRSDLLKVS